MPSGRSGGSSRGGRSSGGFSRSSSSSGGSRGGRGGSYHGGGGGYRHHGPRRWRFGRTYIIISPGRGRAMSAIGVFLVISIIVALIGLVMMTGGNSIMNTIKTDRDYYLQMIATAEANPAREVDAKVIDAWKSDNNPKWYIIYEIDLTDQSGYIKVLEGYSYPVYTMQQAAALNGKDIKVAINKDIVDLNTDSVPIDYKNFALEDDGEYANAKNSHSTGRMILFAGIGVVVLLIVVELSLALSAKRASAAEVQAQQTKAAETQAATIAASTCRYCGARVGPNDRNCSACGATIK